MKKKTVIFIIFLLICIMIEFLIIVFVNKSKSNAIIDDENENESISIDEEAKKIEELAKTADAIVSVHHMGFECSSEDEYYIYYDSLKIYKIREDTSIPLGEKPTTKSTIEEECDVEKETMEELKQLLSQDLEPSESYNKIDKFSSYKIEINNQGYMTNHFNDIEHLLYQTVDGDTFEED